MDADDPNETIESGFLNAAESVATGTDATNPLLIGVHRRFHCFSGFRLAPE
jgi:hypothetical protein